MSEYETHELPPEQQEEIELKHSDKFVGVFSEPSSTFSRISIFKVRTLDWILPVIVVAVLAVASNFILMSNPQIKSQTIDKTMERMEKNFGDMVKKGQMTESQKEEQLDKIREGMESGMSPARIVIQIVSTFIFIFITFFIVSFVYHLVAKTALKGDGTFASMLVANGLTYYINAIQVIVMMIASFIMNKLIAGTSVAAFMGLEKTEFVGFILNKVDPFTIWGLFVFGIAMAKMYKSEQTSKFIIAAFAVWIVWGIISFAIVQAVPFLGFLMG